MFVSFQNVQENLCFGVGWQVSWITVHHTFAFCKRCDAGARLLIQCLFSKGEGDHSELLDNVSFGQG